MRLLRPLVLAVLLLASASPAFADVSFFLGSNSSPSNRQVRGFALGGGSMIAFEFEFATNGEDLEDAAPGLKTFLFNALLQTPIAIAGFQPYVTAGMGFYRETVDATDHQESALAFDSGAGVKTSLFGPLKLRLDYRVIKLRGDPLYSSVHRVYSGLHLVF